MERIFRADVAELGPRCCCAKGIFGIPDGDVDVAEVGVRLRTLVKLAGSIARLAEQEVMGAFPASHEGFVLTGGDLDSIYQDDGLLVHGHNSLIMRCLR